MKREVTIRRQGNKFVVYVDIDGEHRQYEFFRLDDAQAKARKISYIFDLPCPSQSKAGMQ